MNTNQLVEMKCLSRPGGQISYTAHGTGPLIVAVPGMGDLRSSYRELIRPLVDAGYRVAVTDQRGHGRSDTSFREYGDVQTGGDILALIDALGGPAVVLGNSMVLPRQPGLRRNVPMLSLVSSCSRRYSGSLKRLGSAAG